MDPVESGVLAQLQRLLRAEMNEKADALATGGATDWADYRHMVGQIEGLALAERELLDLVARTTDD